MTTQAITLLELNRRIESTLSHTPGLANVWVTGETSDLRQSGPHCYLELIEKDARGVAVARGRATIWGNRWADISTRFERATGARLASGINVMVRASVSYHPVYGLSLNITDVDPSYTLGDLLRRRQQMIDRLTAAGIINQNRSLQWPSPLQRVAVISAAGAAGYGDFVNQLYTNRYGLRFASRLFPAVMQGENTAPSILAALEQIAAEADQYDCVVIIRGGGSTGDLASFDHYELAANIAMFPLPVIIGIGHERDITLLDYVAALRVKTPTAAAEWLIGRGAEALGRLSSLGNAILDAAATAINGAHRRLEQLGAQLPVVTKAIIDAQHQKTGTAAVETMQTALANLMRRQLDALDAKATLLDTLSPEATLRRGYSITRIDGHAVTRATQLAPGTILTTILADGSIKSTVL